MNNIPEDVNAAIDRLVTIARRNTGQSRRVANFLLAWWNAEENGGFDFTDMWSCDRDIVADMIIVFAFVGDNQHYPDSIGYDFTDIWKAWREHTVKR